MALNTKIKEFILLSVLGEGGFGITYLAQDTKLNRKVAIKEYFPSDISFRSENSIKPKTSTADNYKFGLTKFLEEAQTLAQFDHPNIVRVTRFIEANNTAYLIMDYVEGEDLSDYLKRTNFKGNMPETELKSYLVPILKGLQAVHDKGLLHRDIKPGNIYLRKGAEPMLIDFGAARYALGEHSKSMSAIISMGYAPPEQYSTKGKQNQGTDLYAWAATAYQLITGKPPVESPDRSNAHFEGDPDPLTPISQTHQGQYSKQLLSTIDACLQLPNKTRPQSATQVIAMLKGEKPKIDKTAIVDPKQRFKNTHSDTGTKYVKPEERFANTRPKNNRHSSKSTSIIARERSDRGNLLKYAMILFILTGIGAGSYYGYNYYQIQQQQAQQQKIAQQNETTAWSQAQNLNTINGYQLYLDNWPNGAHANQAEEDITQLKNQARLAQLSEQEKQAEQTKQAQRLLTKLGYTVPTSGKLEARTQGAIRDFENKQGILETGTADAILLTALQNAYTKKDNAAWNQAQGNISKLKQYANNYPDGQYINQVDNKLANIRQAQQAAEAEKQRQAKLAADKKAEDDRLAKIAAAEAETQRLAKIAANKARVGKTYNDCSDCPTMVYLPSGSFQMGSNESKGEKPIHRVTIKQFSMSQTEVTFNQWDACYNAGGCSEKADDEGWGRGTRPVINVNWNDAQDYIKWLNNKTGKRYRLPSEAEWEYAARAGSSTKYSWGNSIGSNNANCYGDQCSDSYKNTSTVKSFAKNSFGLYVMHGNVWEWVQDKWHDSYNGAPTNGSAWTSGSSSYRVLRGGSWYN